MSTIGAALRAIFSLRLRISRKPPQAVATIDDIQRLRDELAAEAPTNPRGIDVAAIAAREDEETTKVAVPRPKRGAKWGRGSWK